MTAIQEKLTQFKQKQDEITAMYNETEPKKQELVQEFEKKAADLKAEYTAKIDELQKPLTNLVERYRAELKAWAGITDGEKGDVLSTLMAVHKVMGPKE